jgi:hypothetical protein
MLHKQRDQHLGVDIVKACAETVERRLKPCRGGAETSAACRSGFSPSR